MCPVLKPITLGCDHLQVEVETGFKQNKKGTSAQSPKKGTITLSSNIEKKNGANMQPKEVFKEIYNLPFAQLCLL